MDSILLISDGVHKYMYQTVKWYQTLTLDEKQQLPQLLNQKLTLLQQLIK